MRLVSSLFFRSLLELLDLRQVTDKAVLCFLNLDRLGFLLDDDDDEIEGDVSIEKQQQR